MDEGVIIVTTENIPGYSVKKHVGVVWGTSARSRSVAFEIIALVKSLVGGEINSYKKLMNAGRHEAIRSLAKNAKELGANAVTGMSFGSTQIVPATLDIYAYGTAVIVEKNRK